MKNATRFILDRAAHLGRYLNWLMLLIFLVTGISVSLAATQASFSNSKPSENQEWEIQHRPKVLTLVQWLVLGKKVNDGRVAGIISFWSSMIFVGSILLAFLLSSTAMANIGMLALLTAGVFGFIALFNPKKSRKTMRRALFGVIFTSLAVVALLILLSGF